MNFSNAIVYDIECFPNCFLFSMEMLFSNVRAVWEISDFRDDRAYLFEFFRGLAQNQTPMIGFNNLSYDYPMIHYLWQNPSATAQQLRARNDQIFSSQNRFDQMIWASDRFAPQLDIFKLHHLDNKAKSTGLKTLQINLRSPNVVECSLGFERNLTQSEINDNAIPYNQHDVSETKKVVLQSMDAINFRVGLIEKFGVDVLNWNDAKIGEQTVIKRLGDDLCYERTPFGKRKTRQTPRSQIDLGGIIFPYVKFDKPEFQRILTYLQQQVLRAEEIETFGQDQVSAIKTKGVFTDLKATVGGVDFFYGVGGIHGSVERKRVEANEEWLIRDIDVAALYPSIAIVNRLAPAHLGESFVQIYSELPKERKEWQVKKGKKCTEANGLKLASNGVYGKSNSVFSPFYDPQFTLTITVNGQLLLSMLIEKLLDVPTLQVLQANTDGVTYYIHKDYEPQAVSVCREWENLTKLVLEDANYSRMFLRDVNNYIAIGTDGSMKFKGAYWTPDPMNYCESIATAQPPAFHKNFSNVVSVRAAVAHMVHGVDIEQFIRFCTNPYDFTCSVKINRSDTLMWRKPGLVSQVQRNTRYFISTDGGELTKHSSPTGTEGAYKKASGVSDFEYERVMLETNGAWDARVCTKNKSKYEERRTSLVAGQLVTVCNDINDFRFESVNYQWYIDEAKKLLI